MRCQALLRRYQVLTTCQMSKVTSVTPLSSIPYPWLHYHKSLSPQVQSALMFYRGLASSRRQEVLLPGNVFRSHISDIDIPNVPFHELMFKRFDNFKKAPATSEFLVDKSYTYEDVKTNAIKVASALTRKGYKKGDTILLFATNNIDFTIVMLAASCIGVIITAANPSYTSEELTRHFAQSESIALFTVPMLIPVVKLALENVEKKPKDLFVFGEADGFQPFQNLLDDDGLALPEVTINPKEDTFVLPYSSGTTGLPKGVMLTHRNILSNVLQITKSKALEFGENVLGLLPLYHCFGMVMIQFGAMYSGGHLHYLPKYDVESFLKCLSERKISLAHLVPPLVLCLAKHPAVSNYDLSNLKSIFCGAAPLRKELTLEMEARFAHEISLTQGYGMTETGPVVNIDTGKNVGATGNLVCNTLGKFVDLTSGKALGPNQEGEYCVKGPQMMKGYFNNQSATDEMVTPDGWLQTGDIGYYDENGVVYISDRLKELIKYKGSQIAPAELEAHLLSHEHVQDVAVVGVPDEEAGEIPRAYVVKKPDTSVTEDNLIKFIEERVSLIKRLRGGVKFIDAIPRNPSGKILRRQIKAEHLS